MLRDRDAAAWTFHHNTLRWPFNTLEVEEETWVGAGFKEHPDAPLLPLPKGVELPMSLDAAIARRITCRAFSPAPLPLAQLATLLRSAYGVQGVVSFGSREHLERPVPSGGGLYPLELYVIAQRIEGLPAGVHHYAPLLHGLEQLHLTTFSPDLVSSLFMNQPYLAEAAAILVFTAVTDRTMHKYHDRGYRYLLLECGHAAQNASLAAAALGVGVLPVGGFFDAYLAQLLGVDLEVEVPLYALGLGPATVGAEDRVAHRNLAVLG